MSARSGTQPRIELAEFEDRTNPGPPVVQLVTFVAGFVMLGLVIGLGLSALSPHLYASEGTIRVYNPYRISGSQFGQVDPAAIVASELQYAQSDSIATLAQQVMATRNNSYDHVTWEANAASGSVNVKCYSKTPPQSQRCAEAFASVFVEQRSRASTLPLKLQVQSLGKRIASLGNKVKSLQGAIDRESTVTSTSDSSRGRLAQQSAVLSQIAQLTTLRGNAIAQSKALEQNFQIVNAPQEPTSLASPLLLRNAAVGVAAGLMIGFLVVLTRVNKDQRRGGIIRD